MNRENLFAENSNGPGLGEQKPSFQYPQEGAGHVAQMAECMKEVSVAQARCGGTHSSRCSGGTEIQGHS